jgi:TPR repeat protein
MYRNGGSVSVDLQKAAVWYAKAAEQNYSDAQYRLGLALQAGVGVQRNV